MSKKETHESQLGRDEHIRQETARAAEHGMVPRTPISIARNFRMEALVRSPSAPISRAKVAGAARAVGAVPRGRNGTSLPAAKVAEGAIEDVLGRMNGTNRTQLVPELLAHFGDLAAQAKPGSSFIDVQKRVLLAAFGEHSVAGAHGGDARERRKG